MEAMAKKKRHCTTGEAISVGKQMNVDYTLLTHFSQRYPRVPYLSHQSLSPVGVAFDMMRIKFSWLPRFQTLLPALQTFFEELSILKEREAAEALAETESQRVAKRLKCHGPSVKESQTKKQRPNGE